jgi:glycosyltransferase involved in cell wall biosynthesis
LSKNAEVFPFDIQVLAFNRPEYLEHCLLSLHAQTLAIDPKKIFFWQDGYPGSRDEYLGMPDRTGASLELIKKYFPDSQTYVSPKNLGVGLSFKAAEENAFVHQSNEWGFFLEEDNVLQDYYLNLILQLVEKAKSFDEIVKVDGFGDYKNQIGEDYLIPIHSWAFALRSQHYFERRELLSGYEEILRENSYFKRNETKINNYFANYGIEPLGSSQDYIKRILMSHFKRIALTTTFSGANNIGVFGEHFNPEVYNRLGYQFQKPIVGLQPLPPITEKTIMSLLWNQLGYLTAEFSIGKNLLKSERDGLLVERDGLLVERDGLLEERDGLLEERDGLLEERDGLLEDGLDQQSRIYELKVKNAILDQQFLQVSAEKENLELELDRQLKIVDWHRTHLYVLDNSVRMKIGTFFVKLLLPFKPFAVRFLAILRLFKKLKYFGIKRYLRRIARTVLRLRIIRIVTIYMRVRRFRLLGFWGWKNLRVNLKNLVSVFKTLSQKKQQPFDAVLIQTRAGISRSGFGDIETHAFETLKKDLDDIEIEPFNVSAPLSRVIIDVRCIQAPGLAARGIGKHATFIIKEICSWAKELDLEVTYLASPEIDFPDFLSSSLVVNVLPEKTDATLFFQLSSMTENPITTLPILLNPNSYKIGVFYDFIPRHNPGYYLWGRSAKALYSANLSTLKLYDEFWAISNSVSDELRAHLRKVGRQQTQVFPTGVSAKIPATRNISLESKRTDILIPTGGDARKDPITALAALAVMGESKSINNVVVIGHLPQKAIKELQSIVRGTWVSPKLKILAPVSFDDIALAYSKARLTLVTSLDEGYSLPIVESISMNVPVLGSSIPAHRELLQKKYLFKPKSYFRASRKIRIALRTSLFTKSEEYLNSAQLLVAENLIPARLATLKINLAVRPRSTFTNNFRTENFVTVVSPWPPLKTGIADYSESTLRDPSFKIVCSDVDNIERKDLRAWNWCEVAKSKRLFVLGNNHNFHSSAMYALMKMGGNALIHDTRILDMWSNLFGAHSFDYIKRFKPISREDFDNSFMNLDNAVTLGFEPLIPSAHSFITHSELLKEHLKSIGAKNVDCIPFAARIPNFAPIKPDKLGEKDFIVGVFGITDLKTKHFDLIYEACAELAIEFPSMRLVCVGEMLNDAANFLDQENRRAPSWLQLKGRVNESEYWELLAKSNLTIHVRKIRRLSLSGAVMDSLAMGTPVVCSESILSEMQIPVGFPYSESLGDTCSLAELKNVIKKMIQLENGAQPDRLMEFARSRDSLSYLHELKAVFG